MAEDTYDPRYDFKVPEFGGFDDEHDEDELAKYFEYDHENEIPLDLGENFDPPTAKRSKQDENSQPLPRRSLRSTPARQQTADKNSGIKLQDDNVQKDATPQKERRGTLTLETPKEGRRQTRKQSLGSEKPAPQEVKAHNQSVSGAPANLCTSLASWNKMKKENAPENKSENKPAVKQPLRNLPQRPPTGKSVLTTEQRELEKIRQLREDVTKKRRIAEKSHKRALSSSSAHRPMRSTHVTKVNEFAFATDKRVTETKPVAEEKKNFTEMLRHYQPIETQHKGPTMPIETKLYTRKRKLTQEAEKDAAPLWSKTPDRFHTKPKNTKFIPSNKRRRSLSMECKVTIPVTPKLESQKRARRVNVVSQKDLEEKEVEECSNYRFRARPLNEKIFHSAYCGLPKKDQKEPTVAISPKFATDKRIHQHNTKEESKMQTSFHARPIPKGMLSGCTGIKEVPSHPATVPHSPAFALRNRMRSSASNSSNNSTLSNESLRHEQDDHIIRANPMPDLDKKFEVKIQRSVVRQEPFSFDTRDQGISQRRQKLIKEEEMRLEKMREFHARDPGVLHKAPFIPKASTRPMTDVTDFRLNTEIRSTEREKFEMQKAQTEQELALSKMEKERLQEEEERKEVERIRREAVHKAQPIRHFKPVQLQKSTVPITVAQSPRFSTRLKDRSTHHRNQSLMNTST